MTNQGQSGERCKCGKAFSLHIPDNGKFACPTQSMDESVPIQYFEGVERSAPPQPRYISHQDIQRGRAIAGESSDVEAPTKCLDCGALEAHPIHRKQELYSSITRHPFRAAAAPVEAPHDDRILCRDQHCEICKPWMRAAASPVVETSRQAALRDLDNTIAELVEAEGAAEPVAALVTLGFFHPGAPGYIEPVASAQQPAQPKEEPFYNSETGYLEVADPSDKLIAEAKVLKAFADFVHGYFIFDDPEELSEHSKLHNNALAIAIGEILDPQDNVPLLEALRAYKLGAADPVASAEREPGDPNPNYVRLPTDPQAKEPVISPLCDQHTSNRQHCNKPAGHIPPCYFVDDEPVASPQPVTLGFFHPGAPGYVELAVASVPQPAQRECRDYPTLQIAESNLADYAKRYFESFDMYLHAWLREMGGVIVPKHHQIDGFVLRARGIYEKAQLVDRIKKILCDQLKAKADAEQMFSAVFKFLVEDGHDKIPTN